MGARAGLIKDYFVFIIMGDTILTRSGSQDIAILIEEFKKLEENINTKFENMITKFSNFADGIRSKYNVFDIKMDEGFNKCEKMYPN